MKLDELAERKIFESRASARSLATMGSLASGIALVQNERSEGRGRAEDPG
jgi:hypothetical protein